MEELRMNFGELLLKLRKQKEFKQEYVASQIGVKKNTISNYENNISKPHYEQLVKLCNLFEVDANYFLQCDITSVSNKFNPEDQNIIDKYKTLTPHDKEIVDYILDMKYEPELKTIYRFPVFYQSAAAGIGRLSETNDYHMEEFILKSIPHGAVFGMYIKGHSMETKIFENDVVLIAPSIKTYNELQDEIVVALFGEELICKRFSVNEDNQTYDFSSDNLKDKDKGRFHQKQSDFKMIGKVVKIIHAYETGKGLFNYSDD